MWSVTAALVPAWVCSVLVFGFRALLIECIAIASAVATEAVIQKARGVRVTVSDGSAFLTGLLLAFCISPAVPLWLPAVGSAFGIAVAKQAFGGLGCNIFNPALAGRTFVMHSWLTNMTQWVPPLGAGGVDALTYATPLGAAKNAVAQWMPGGPGGLTDLDLFLGNTGGSIGETSALALLAGGVFLLALGYITWEIPVSFIGMVALLTWLLPSSAGRIALSPLEHMLSGGLFLGAFFMATDMVTSPLTGKGKLLFGCGCGALTSLIRLYGGFPEGVCYSILIMNAFTPLIDHYLRPPAFGTR